MKLLKRSLAKVSVILPTYNRGVYLKQAMGSVLTQTFNNFELIIINDGSTDESEKIINSFNDQRIVYIRQKNKGEYPATNLGLRVAEGKYLTWIHSDDLMPKNSLETRVRMLEKNPGIDFVHGDIKNIDKKGKETNYLEAVNMTAKDAFVGYYKSAKQRTKKYLVHHTTIMFRRELLPKVGMWDESLPYAGDLDWLLRALRVSRIKKVSGVLYLYRNHPGARRITDRKKGVNTEEVVKFIKARYA